MLEQFPLMFDAIVQRLGLIALLLSSYIIVLSANRDAFDTDPRPRTVKTPLGDVVTYIEWKYMSRHAEDCRTRLSTFVRVFHGVITFLLILVVTSFVVDALLWMLASKPLSWLGMAHDWSGWLVRKVSLAGLLGLIVEMVVLLMGPVLMFYLSRIVYSCVQARKHFDQFKLVANVFPTANGINNERSTKEIEHGKTSAEQRGGPDV